MIAEVWLGHSDVRTLYELNDTPAKVGSRYRIERSDLEFEMTSDAAKAMCMPCPSDWLNAVPARTAPATV